MYGSALLFLPLLQQDSDAQRTTLGNPGGNDAVGFGFSTIESRRQTRLLDIAVSGRTSAKAPMVLVWLVCALLLASTCDLKIFGPHVSGSDKHPLPLALLAISEIPANVSTSTPERL